MHEWYADVIVDITHERLDRTFQYRIPKDMKDILEPGMVVEIPFGAGNRLISGYVTGISDRTDYEPEKIKEISRIVMDAADGESRLISLAAWMKSRYGSTMIQALKTVLPVKRKIQAKEKKTLYLEVSQEEAKERLAVFQKKHQNARVRLLEALIDEPILPGELVTEKLHVTGTVIHSLEKMGILSCKSSRTYRNPEIIQGTGGKSISLNEEQQLIVDTVTDEWEQKDSLCYLIHGVTGSGKTEVYMELAAYAVSRHEQVIVLIPEISLTYQTLMRFYRRFGDRVSVINSRMSAGERYDQFERARTGKVDVMIGPRSALFTPFSNLGLIVIDEEHEPAYQSETQPRYHAREAALQRGRAEGAKVVLGSATPSMEAYYRAETGRYRLFVMKNRAGEASLPSVSVTDMREELRAGNRSILSNHLHELMEDRLAKGEQIMLFLNRRGLAGFVSCRSCGHVIKCPHCDVSLALHKNGRMVCHYCGYEQPQVTKCPECGSPFIRSFKAGTQQVETEVRKAFPDAEILRMDYDTTREKNGHTKILSSFANHEADILIGTQMIVKGHDFPDVTLVGILAADLSLYVPDFRAAERTFQLLTQAAGRAGRAGKAGDVVIQTYDPGHYSIQTAAKQDYEAFYEEEITYRQMAGYPPTGALLALHCSGAEEQQLTVACDYLRKFIEKVSAKDCVSILGPTEEAVAKIQDVYRRVIYVKCIQPEVLIKIRSYSEKYVAVNRGFDGIAIQYELND